MPLTPKLAAAYDDLYLATSGDEKTKRRIGNPANLPRPWDPPTCRSLNYAASYGSGSNKSSTGSTPSTSGTSPGGAMIPPCWPQHPHLVHEIAVVADQRRRASIDTSSNSLEEWHRYTIPAFTERLKFRTRTLCEEDTSPGPDDPATRDTPATTRPGNANVCYDTDIAGLADLPARRPRLRIVDDDGNQIDAATGEVIPD